MRRSAFAVGLLWVICGASPETPADTRRWPTPGFSVGIAYAADDGLDDFGWSAAVSGEWLVGRTAAIRARLGAIDVDGGTRVSEPDAGYAFVAADLLRADVVSPAIGVGLYRVKIRAPGSPGTGSEIEPGIHAGVRFLLPYRHERGIALEAAVHRVLGSGPSLVATLGAGMVF